MLIPFGVFSAGAGGPKSYELISTTLISTNTASVTFNVSTLASTYKHLQLRVVNRINQADYVNNLNMRFNSDTGSNYYQHFLNGTGSTVSSFGFADSQMFIGQTVGTSAASGIFNASITDILDAFSTSKNKTVRNLYGTAGVTNNQIGLISNLWNSTAAITSLSIYSTTYSFVAGTRLSLYGVRG